MISNDITQELSTNFIEYAAACNTDRAIPNAKDGLKPVAKRILWAAKTKVKCTSDKPHIKTAKLVGEVISSLHPHGDSSVYGALTRLSQNWVMRYPLIDFHGNNGNVIGDGPAHMRYTECRLSKITEDGMLEGTSKRNVDFIPNYDETTEEPVILPSIFPNLLCNPNNGIGVAIACSFAPNNLKEVANAIKQYINGQEPMLPGPDFPTGGVVINKKDIPAIMKTGHGSVKVRGKYTIEGSSTIVFTEIPYGVSVENIIESIGTACDKKEIEGIDNIRDESNKNGIRIVIECEKGIRPETVIPLLFAKTNLQNSFSYNQIALVDKVPTELNLKDCIKIYVDHNIECIIKETQYDLHKAIDRKEIIDGLLKALVNIDDIISLIKNSESAATAKIALINTYGFTDRQATSILEMKLSRLAKLEAIKLNKEKADLEENITKWKNILENETEQTKILVERLDNLVTLYGDERRTELLDLDDLPQAANEIPSEDVMVILTNSGNIRRTPKASYKRSINNIAAIDTNTTEYVLVFTNMGKFYRISVNSIPTTAKGSALSSLVSIDINEKPIAVIPANLDNISSSHLIFFTNNGFIKKSLIKEYKIKRSMKTGSKALKLKEDDSVISVLLADNTDEFIINNEDSIKSKAIPATGKLTFGNRISKEKITKVSKK